MGWEIGPRETVGQLVLEIWLHEIQTDAAQRAASGWIGDALYVFTADERPFAVRIDWVSATEANEFIEIAGTALQRDRDQHRLNCRACGLEVWSGPTGVITIRPDGESSTLLLVTPSTNHAAQLIEAVR